MWVADQPTLNLCLPTGSTPAPVYRTLARDRADMSGSTVFLLDEFVLPGESPGRCDAMLRRDLLDLIDREPSVVGWDTTGNLDSQAAHMEGAIRRAGGIDLALLGLGMNGHIGMNEPGSSPTSRSRVVHLAEATAMGALRYGAEVKPSHGVTLGIGTLLEAGAIWLLVSGALKADVLRTALEGPISGETPATFLRNHANLTVFADESAASALGGH